MMANTKLNINQKLHYKELLEEHFARGGDIAVSGNVTVCRMQRFPRSTMAKFAVSVCSDNEKKFRHKVGEYYALKRLLVFGQYVQMPADISAKQFADFVEFIERR